jgi:hypothetical protein
MHNGHLFACATNGYILLAYRGEATEDPDYGMMAYAASGSLTKGFIVPAQLLGDALKGEKLTIKGNPNTLHPKDCGTKIVVESMGAEKVLQADAISEEFPNYFRLLPKAPAAKSISRFCVDPEYLNLFAKAARVLGCGEVSIYSTGTDRDAHVVRFLGQRRIFGMLMPMRGEEPETSFSSFFGGASDPEKTDTPAT